MASEDEGAFTRRVRAVLLADVSGFSMLMGEDDERTARAFEQLHVLVQGIISQTHGYAEPEVALGVMLFKPLGAEGENGWMREDRSGFRQLTAYRGETASLDGTVVDVELPGPMAYSAPPR